MGVANMILSATLGAAGASGLLIALIRAGTITVPVLRRKVRQIRSPNASTYQEGDNQPHPFGDTPRLQLDPQKLGTALYPFVISAVVPRPIAFIASLSKEGLGNLSPYSYFNVMSHDPPYVTIGTCHTRARPGGSKDSETNIMETGEFTLNMMSEWFVEAANFTCGNYARGVNEMELANFKTLPSTRVKPPILQEAAVNLECKLRNSYEVKNSKGDTTARIIIGEVVMVHVLEAVTRKTATGQTVVDFEDYAPVCRLGGDTYGRITHTYDLPRPGTEWQERRLAAVAVTGKPSGK